MEDDSSFEVYGPYGGEGQKTAISDFAKPRRFAKPNREFVIAGISRSYVLQKGLANLRTLAEALAMLSGHQKISATRIRRNELIGRSNFFLMWLFCPSPPYNPCL